MDANKFAANGSNTAPPDGLMHHQPMALSYSSGLSSSAALPPPPPPPAAGFPSFGPGSLPQIPPSSMYYNPSQQPMPIPGYPSYSHYTSMTQQPPSSSYPLMSARGAGGHSHSGYPPFQHPQMAPQSQSADQDVMYLFEAVSALDAQARLLQANVARRRTLQQQVQTIRSSVPRSIPQQQQQQQQQQYPLQQQQSWRYQQPLPQQPYQQALPSYPPPQQQQQQAPEPSSALEKMMAENISLQRMMLQQLSSANEQLIQQQQKQQQQSVASPSPPAAAMPSPSPVPFQSPQSPQEPLSPPIPIQSSPPLNQSSSSLQVPRPPTSSLASSQSLLRPATSLPKPENVASPAAAPAPAPLPPRPPPIINSHDGPSLPPPSLFGHSTAASADAEANASHSGVAQDLAEELEQLLKRDLIGTKSKKKKQLGEEDHDNMGDGGEDDDDDDDIIAGDLSHQIKMEEKRRKFKELELKQKMNAVSHKQLSSHTKKLRKVFFAACFSNFLTDEQRKTATLRRESTEATKSSLDALATGCEMYFRRAVRQPLMAVINDSQQNLDLLPEVSASSSASQSSRFSLMGLLGTSKKDLDAQRLEREQRLVKTKVRAKGMIESLLLAMGDDIEDEEKKRRSTLLRIFSDLTVRAVHLPENAINASERHFFLFDQFSGAPPSSGSASLPASDPLIGALLKQTKARSQAFLLLFIWTRVFVLRLLDPSLRPDIKRRVASNMKIMATVIALITQEALLTLFPKCDSSIESNHTFDQYVTDAVPGPPAPPSPVPVAAEGSVPESVVVTRPPTAAAAAVEPDMLESLSHISNRVTDLVVLPIQDRREWVKALGRSWFQEQASLLLEWTKRFHARSMSEYEADKDRLNELSAEKDPPEKRKRAPFKDAIPLFRRMLAELDEKKKAREKKEKEIREQEEAAALYQLQMEERDKARREQEEAKQQAQPQQPAEASISDPQSPAPPLYPPAVSARGPSAAARPPTATASATLKLDARGTIPKTPSSRNVASS